MSRRSSFLLAACIAAWVALVISGFAALQRYAAKEGILKEPEASAMAWLRQHQHPGRPLLVMAIHARCPCTDASLSELGDFLSRAGGECDALLLRYVPASASADWPADHNARELGGQRVPVLVDPDGRIAAQLGAFTSGSIVFLDRNSEIRFHGGLTVERGHRGRSPAQDALLRVVAASGISIDAGSETLLKVAPVYGCELGAAEQQPEVCR